MDSIETLLTLARRYCNENAEHRYRKYEANRPATRGCPEEDYARYQVLDGIRTEVGALLDVEFDSLEECRERLVVAGQNAQTLYTAGGPKHYQEALAIRDEREKFIEYIRNVRDADLLHVPPLPYARRLHHSETEELRKKFRERWNYTGHYWVPLGGTCPEPFCVLALKNIEEDDRKRIIDFVASIASERIYRFDADWLDYEIEKSAFKLDGNETVYVDASFDWIVYVSHEATVTFGGRILNEYVRKIFSDREELIDTWFATPIPPEGPWCDGPLHFSIKNHAVSRLADLLQTETDVNRKGEYGRTPLHLAAMSGQTEAVRLLLDAGADADILNNSSRTPLYDAVDGNHFDTVALLLQRGADKNKSHPLHLAVKQGRIEMLRVLLDAGADANALDWYDNTPLYYAAEERKPEAVDLLLRYGADPNFVERNDRVPLFRAARNGDIEIVRILLEAGANVNRLDGSGWSALHTAAVQGDVDVVGLLLEAGAILDIRNQYGWTPLFLAAGSGRKAVAEKLLAAGADVRAKDAKGLTPLQNARKNGHQEVIVLLQQAAGLLPKKELAERLPEQNWEKLLWNWPNAGKPYVVQQWQEILDGLVESFRKFLDIHFVHAEIPVFYEENNFPGVSFRLYALSPTPLGPLNLLGLGSVSTYDFECGKRIDAHVWIFLFLDGVRLKTEVSDNVELPDDYIEFHLLRNEDGTSAWESTGWQQGFPCEWDGLTFPQKTAVTDRLQVIPPYVPDPDDERYDPVTEAIRFQQCSICQDDYVYPYRDRNSNELFWICGCCHTAWKKHDLFTPENSSKITDRELEPLPYRHIVDDAAHYGTFPLEASHICQLTSNRFNIYECQMPRECYEKAALAHRWNMEPIKESTCIPRYHFRSFLEEQGRIPSVEELRRRLPDSPFLHRAEQGFECRLKKRDWNIHVVYDTGNETLYFYCFTEGGDDSISEKSRRFHDTLQELCRERSAE